MVIRQYLIGHYSQNAYKFTDSKYTTLNYYFREKIIFKKRQIFKLKNQKKEQYNERKKEKEEYQDFSK